MVNMLTTLIDKLKLTPVIRAKPNLVATLVDIEKYGESNNSIAYYLGHFFKSFIKTDDLPAQDKSYLLNTIRKLNLEPYFYLREKVAEEPFGILFYILSIGGLLAILAGIYQLINGDFWYGLGTKYLLPVVREGGYKVIIGLIMLVGGIVRLKYEKRKRLFITTLTARGNNIA